MAKAKIEDIKNTILMAKPEDDWDSWDGISFPTGSTIVDLIAGAGRTEGFASGSLVNICGASGSGKSFLVAETIAQSYIKFGSKLRVRLADTEGGVTFNTEKLYGITIPEEAKAPIVTVEEAHADIKLFLENLQPDEAGLYIIDSWDGVSSSEIEERADERASAYVRDKEYDKQTFGGGKHKHASTEMWPNLMSILKNKKAVIIVTSQIRENFGAGMYAPKYKVTGGGALLFYANCRLWLKPKHKIEVENTPIGYVVNVEAHKSRGDRPFREGLSTFYFEYGLDDVGTCVDYLFDFRSADTGKLLSRTEKETEWDDKVHANRDELIAYIESNNQEAVLREATRAAWEEKEKRIIVSLAGRKSKNLVVRHEQ